MSIAPTLEAERAAPKMLPCPFCGSENLSIETNSVQPDDFHDAHVVCDDCDASGRHAMTLEGWLSSKAEAKEEAIVAWNRRTAAPVAEGVALPPKQSIDTIAFRALLSRYNQGEITEAQLIAYIDGHTAGPAAPEGYALAPLEPTEAMLKAAVRAFQSSYNDADTLADWREAYKASIAAAPSSLPPQEEDK